MPVKTEPTVARDPEKRRENGQSLQVQLAMSGLLDAV